MDKAMSNDPHEDHIGPIRFTPGQRIIWSLSGVLVGAIFGYWTGWKSGTAWIGLGVGIAASVVGFLILGNWGNVLREDEDAR
jgi:hypothetical protein